ncbi:hypothetical protein INR49_030367 [Caranx melampygus]|nr:hypothetical protein INR49_030367 [Caranx melampygus]
MQKRNERNNNNPPYQIVIMIRRSSRDHIPRVTGHLSVIFTSQTVGCQWCGGFLEKLRVLPRSNPNIIPYGSGHKSRDNLHGQSSGCQTLILPSILRWLVKLRNCVVYSRCMKHMSVRVPVQQAGTGYTGMTQHLHRCGG